LLHETLGVSPFSEEDIEYFSGCAAPRAFPVSSGVPEGRLDATNHGQVSANYALDKPNQKCDD
jgi:hypothetical protein